MPIGLYDGTPPSVQVNLSETTTASDFIGIADVLNHTSMVDGSAEIHAGANAAITCRT